MGGMEGGSLSGGQEEQAAFEDSISGTVIGGTPAKRRRSIRWKFSPAPRSGSVNPRSRESVRTEKADGASVHDGSEETSRGRRATPSRPSLGSRSTTLQDRGTTLSFSSAINPLSLGISARDTSSHSQHSAREVTTGSSSRYSIHTPSEAQHIPVVCSQSAANTNPGNSELSQLQLLTSLTTSLSSLVDSFKSIPPVVNQDIANSAAAVWASPAAALSSNNGDSAISAHLSSVSAPPLSAVNINALPMSEVSQVSANVPEIFGKEALPCTLSPLGFHLPFSVKEKIIRVDLLSLLPSSKEFLFKGDKKRGEGRRR